MNTNLQTHDFTLPSGVPCTVTELGAIHQEALTRQSGNNGNGFRDMMKLLIIKLGSITDITDEVIRKMLSADRKWALAEARAFSMGIMDEAMKDFKDVDYKEQSKMFQFKWAYIDATGEKKELDKEVSIEKGMPMKPYLKQWTEYPNHDDRMVDIVLPSSKKKVKYELLSGEGEERLALIDKSNISTNTIIEMRDPVVFNPALGEKGKWMPLRLNDLNLTDIECLRLSIQKNEGKVDSEILIINPVTEKEIPIDILGQVSFFFPSEAI